MASPLSFDKLSVKNLQEFLRDRGVSTTGYNKPRLVKLAAAVADLNLPVDPDLAGPSHSVDATLQEKLRRAGCCFSNPANLPGFTTNFEDIPDFGIYDIFNYLVLNRTDYDRRKLKAFKSFEDYRLFVDGHVENLEWNSVSAASDVCVFKAKVKPTQKDKTYLNKTTYSVWLVMNKTRGEVNVAYCECPGGSDGACRHLAAVLYEIEAFDKKACTDGPAQWKRRARHHDVPTQLDNLTVRRARYRELDPPNSNQSSTKLDFDPRAVEDQQQHDEDKMKEFATSLAKVHPTCSALEFLPGAPDPPVKSTSASIDHLSVKTRILQGDTSSTATIMKALEYSSQERMQIEKGTRGQATEEQWHEMRKGRLTASNFHAIMRSKKEGGGTLAKRVLEGSAMEHVPAAIEWGRRKEKAALRQYTKVEKLKHRKFAVQESGLVVMEKEGYVGASPDAVASCKCKDCPEKWLVEIKCPYTERESHPRDAALMRGISSVNNKLVCDEECKYFAQVQGQMGVCGVDRCDLVIYTKKGVCCVTIDFDEEFFSKMLERLQDFFTTNILPKLLE